MSTSKAFANVSPLRRQMKEIIDWGILMMKYFLSYYSFIFFLSHHILQSPPPRMFAILLHNVNSLALLVIKKKFISSVHQLGIAKHHTVAITASEL